MIDDYQILNTLCNLCQNTYNICKYSYIVREGKICDKFIPKYDCVACRQHFQCNEDILCYRFVPKELIVESDKPHPIQKQIIDILSDLMRIEKSIEESVIYFKQNLESNGIKAAVKDRVLEGYTDNLVALYVLNRLIDSLGLNTYKDKIINNEIDRIFKSDK